MRNKYISFALWSCRWRPEVGCTRKWQEVVAAARKDTHKEILAKQELLEEQVPRLLLLSLTQALALALRLLRIDSPS